MIISCLPHIPAMPLYRMGDLKGAVKRGIVLPGSAGRRQRVDIAHGLLSAGESQHVTVQKVS